VLRTFKLVEFGRYTEVILRTTW